MRLLFLTLLCTSLSLSAQSDFRKWTNKDGRSADLKLIEVTGEKGEEVGNFKMRNGRSVTIKAADLTEDDAALLAAWEPPAPVVEGKPSVFDKVLDGNLVILDGKSLKKHTLKSRPKKYYVFYYTASWCGPCQQFTPSLVDFYEKNKSDNFEIVLITSDSNEAAMENYAVQKKMPWPQLKMKDVKKFRQEFQHGVTGIPSVIVCDLEGKNLGNHRDLAALEKLVK